MAGIQPPSPSSAAVVLGLSGRTENLGSTGWLPARIAWTVYHRAGKSVAIVRLHTETCSCGTHCRGWFTTSLCQVGLLAPERCWGLLLINPFSSESCCPPTWVFLQAFQWIDKQRGECFWNLTRRLITCLWLDPLALLKLESGHCRCVEFTRKQGQVPNPAGGCSSYSGWQWVPGWVLDSLLEKAALGRMSFWIYLCSLCCSCRSLWIVR